LEAVSAFRDALHSTGAWNRAVDVQNTCAMPMYAFVTNWTSILKQAPK
jgi:hypothetical protein